MLFLVAGVAAVGIFEQGFKTSPFFPQFAGNAARMQAVDATKLPQSAVYVDYPANGAKPVTIKDGFSYLPSSIGHITVAVAGRTPAGSVGASWTGRSSYSPSQMWSSTKSLMFPYLVQKAAPHTANSPSTWTQDGFKFTDIIKDIESYSFAFVGKSSNCLSTSLKGLTPRSDQENWLKTVTGDKSISFLGGYGEAACLNPTLKSGSTSLLSGSSSAGGDNLITTYSMARIYSNMAWMSFLPDNKKIPGLSYKGSSDMSPVFNAMSFDECRYVDVALKNLGLLAPGKITNVSLISKMGGGYPSASPGTSDLTYSAALSYFQVSTGKQRSIAFSIKASTGSDAGSDAALLNAVTEIIKRVNSDTAL